MLRLANLLLFRNTGILDISTPLHTFILGETVTVESL